MTYNVANVFAKAVQDFNTTRIPVVYDLDQKGQTAHTFSQKELISSIDLAWNSLYKDGKLDREKKRKLYINTVRFYTEVSVKNTDIDIKNYVFTPTDYSTENKWAVWFFGRQFSTFVKDSGYAKTINDLNFSLRKYGSCVSKKVGENVSIVPIRSLILDQKAQSLMSSIEGGFPVIEEHEYSHYEMSQFVDWELPEDFEGKRLVQEGYIMLSKKQYNDVMGLEEDENDADEYKKELYVVIVMPSGKKEEDKRQKYDAKVLYCEKAELPYVECHTGKQDHRWLGMGEVEKQLENQIAKNLSTNLRVRGMEWAVKNIYQKAGDPIGRSLVSEVKDGEVLEVGLNGQISRIDTSTRALADFQQHDNAIDDNAQKQSFAFESATGESFSSGTPFRLGAMLSNSVMSHFDLEKENFSFFLKESFFKQIIPIFEQRSTKDLFIIGSTDTGFEKIKDLYAEIQTNRHIINLATSPEIFEMKYVPTRSEVKTKVLEMLDKENYLYTELPKGLYKGAKYKIDLDITGESRDNADKETLITLYTELSRKGDPRSDKVLDVILGSMGKNMESIIGKAPQASPVAQTSQNNPDLQGLVPQA